MTLSGIDLAHGYYTDVIAPLLAERWPGLPHAAARLGRGSDVLGLDDEMSRDHDWGLRLTLLVRTDAVSAVREHLTARLPTEYAGHPTRFATTWHPLVTHQVEVDSPGNFAFSRLGVDATRPLTDVEWLSLTGQALLEVTAGPVFTDTSGELTAIRDRLRWYPDDLWRYVLAADWARIGQEFPFIGRTGSRGDDIGSCILTARIAQAAMRLGFLLERQWPPYSKWLGTLFSRLPRAGEAMPALHRASSADTWQEREAALAEALTLLHDLQRPLGLPGVDEVFSSFYDRPFLGLGGVPEALRDSITDPAVRALPVGIGSIEQLSDNVNVLTSPAMRLATMRSLVPNAD
ncbi:DUF4037 domain-containing protein [Mycetocola zhadangensis]|uniref:DUF4037 domain-containing protein n=1 Tax=Mycetocola zhadangensis TaxID=1164595 RepID=A0A3L7ITB2_9MICO|nr:DUF4037 domain-containing protein [Mycetocola zhadangensis]RLQ81433.1 DUF4037 domain-containing protein [Mycetocola zhadangensis]GGF01722.1 hypothetical protein GCM10011313_26050 [Mycetocola zhadangensis]